MKEGITNSTFWDKSIFHALKNIKYNEKYLHHNYHNTVLPINMYIQNDK